MTAGNDVEMPRFLDSLDLAAVETAVSCARMFTEITLVRWRARRILGTALEAVSDLVAISVHGGQDGDLVQVRLVGLEASIRIEVRDPGAIRPNH